MNYLNQMELKGKRVFVRVDFNVPIEDGVIQDDSRIKAALPTLKYILQNGASLVICSHLGKPKGKVKTELSLKPVSERLAELLNQEVSFAKDCIGEEVRSMVLGLGARQVVLLENLRFHEQETANDSDFSRELAELGDIYVNDAFGMAHRAHASVAGVTAYAEKCCAGLLLQKEIEYLGKALAAPEHPFVLISGGAKVSTKLGILNNLLDKVDRIIIGGAMANTFRKAQGYPVGKSLIEKELINDAREIMDKALAKGCSFYLPVDYILGSDPKSKTSSESCAYQNVPEDKMILDTGPATHVLFSEVLKDARTVVWNGPMGAFENSAFSQGSFGLAQSVSSVQGLTIVGGGDTDSLIHKCGLEDKFSFISTGGGSFLEFLEGKKLPAIQALEECAS